MLGLGAARHAVAILATVAALRMLAGLATPAAAEQTLPEGYWSLEESQPILDKTRHVRLAPDLSGLSADERRALDRLFELGELFERRYRVSRHHQALEAYEELQRLHTTQVHTATTQNLLDLYWMFQGPIATTLDNKREPFVPVDPTVPGKNVYPWGVAQEPIEAFLARHPDARASLLGVRTVVRQSDAASVAADLDVLTRFPTLDRLHPGLRGAVQRAGAAGDSGYYAVPYSVAYPEETMRAFDLLYEAAALMQPTDAQFADFLRLRAHDLLTDNYEGGDAAWVSGRFQKLNAQIGAYEVYDDELYAAKAFHSVSLLLRDAASSEALQSAIGGIQEIQDSLPYDGKRRVRDDIPVGVYHVIADFGQSRGTNTATILPNEPHITRKYGRTILLRYNILTHPDLFEDVKQTWGAALAQPHIDDLTPDGNFYRVLWHEIGHYLGPDLTASGQPVDDAMGANSSTFEEMKADLVSLYAARALHQRGYHDAERLRSVYAAGIRRVLRPNKPRRAQAYATMQLMQFNWFLENGLLRYDENAGVLHVDYGRYHDVVTAMLTEVLKIQHRGDKAASDAFIERYTTWDEDLHGALAAAMQQARRYRYRMVKYAALGQ